MRKMGESEIAAEADFKYRSYVAHYGLRNSKKIVLQVARLLRAEETRRKKLKVEDLQ